jgi:hypothetical protein
MEKQFLIEVNRISELMGVKPLIVEQVWMYKLWKTARTLFPDSFDNMIKYVDDGVSTKANKMAEAGEITRKEADDLISALKNKTDDALKYLKDGGSDIDAYIQKVTSEPKVQKIYKKVSVAITDAEMTAIRKMVLDNWSGFDDWYKAFKDKGFSYLEKDYNKLVTKDQYLQNFAKLDTTGAFNDFPELLEKMVKKAETDPEIDDFFKSRASKSVSDDVSEKIVKVADEAATGKKPFTSKMEMPNGEIIDVPEGTYYVKTLDDLGEEVLVQKSLDDLTEIPEGKIKLSDFADDGAKTTKKGNEYLQIPEMGRISKIYWNVVEPSWRWYQKTMKFFIDDWFLKKTGADYFKTFDDAFKSGFRSYAGGGKFNGADKAYMRRTIETFQRIVRNNPDIEGGLSQDIYKKLWDDYVEKGRKYFADNPANLKKFNEYVSEVENFKSTSGRNLSMSEIFGDMGKAADDDIAKGMKTYRQGIDDYLPSFVKKTLDFVEARAKNILSLFFTGRWKTPADFSRKLLKNRNLAKNIDAQAFGTEDLVKTAIQTKSAAFYDFMGAVSIHYLVIPAGFGLIQAMLDGHFTAESQIQAAKTKGYDTTFDAVMNGYIWNNIANGYNLDDGLLSKLYEKFGWDDKDENGVSWADAYGKFAGKLDNSLLSITEYGVKGLGALFGWKFSSAEEKVQAKKEEGKQKLREKGLLNRENLPEQSGPYSKNATFFMKYLVDPSLRMYVENSNDKNINTLKGGFVAEFVRSDSNKIWVEDPSVEKKYEIIYDPNGATNIKKSPFYWDDNGTQKSIFDLVETVGRGFGKTEEKQKKENEALNSLVKGVMGESIYKKRIMENSGKKFGEDNFKHWKKTFTFFNFDNENGEYKEVKITSKMDEIMDTIDHYRKKYDEDDSFVRAVIDVFGDKIDRVSFNKDMAHLTESVRVFGLMKVLANIRESKELEIWTVKHYSDGNWELVKGSFNKKELQNVGKTVKDREKEQEERKKPVDGLKKKEQEAIISLKNDESSGLENLPIKVKEKVKEKLSKGWTTEEPMQVFDEFYDKSEINSVFNEKIEIYKLDPTKEFLNSLVKNSSRISLKRGFCKSLKTIKNEVEMNDKQKQVLTHFITKCNNKYNTLTKKYKPLYND